jgi:hypothetical protein
MTAKIVVGTAQVFAGSARAFVARVRSAVRLRRRVVQAIIGTSLGTIRGVAESTIDADSARWSTAVTAAAATAATTAAASSLTLALCESTGREDQHKQAQKRCVSPFLN